MGSTNEQQQLQLVAPLQAAQVAVICVDLTRPPPPLPAGLQQIRHPSFSFSSSTAPPPQLDTTNATPLPLPLPRPARRQPEPGPVEQRQQLPSTSSSSTHRMSKKLYKVVAKSPVKLRKPVRMGSSANCRWADSHRHHHHQQQQQNQRGRRDKKIDEENEVAEWEASRERAPIPLRDPQRKRHVAPHHLFAEAHSSFGEPDKKRRRMLDDKQQQRRSCSPSSEKIKDSRNNNEGKRLSSAKGWTQTAPAGKFYRRLKSRIFATEELRDLHDRFAVDVFERIAESKIRQPTGLKPPVTAFYQKCTCGGGRHSSSESSDEQQSSVRNKKKIKQSGKKKKKTKKEGNGRKNLMSSSSSGEVTDSSNTATNTDSEEEEKAAADVPVQNERFQMALAELQRKKSHPARLHPQIWFNEPCQMNDGPLCRCSWKSRRSGIRHQIYAGEKSEIATTVVHDEREYRFEGFSIFTHRPVPEKLPVCRLTRWNIEYSISVSKEELPEGYCVRDLDYIYRYLFEELLEMVDVKMRPWNVNGGCPIFHVMPRFSRSFDEGGKELLPMSALLAFLLRQQSKQVVSQELLEVVDGLTESEWAEYALALRGQLVSHVAKKPTAIRLDALHRTNTATAAIVHFGVKPAVLTYSGNPQYQKAWKQYVKMRHLFMVKEKMNSEDKEKLAKQEALLRKIRGRSGGSRDVLAEVSSDGFRRTGFYSDVVQQAMMLLPIFQHIRFHWSLVVFERRIGRVFENRALLELAFTHPSYRNTNGPNPDHARNTLSNCGLRQPVFGNERSVNSSVTRKRGIHTLLNIMSQFGVEKATESLVKNNERLEYLGDAVVEFLATIHLFFMFPDLDEGGLATYRSALVQNRHLAVLAKKLGLDELMLYAHGPDLCHETDLRHAMANAFEALMGAVFLDAGLAAADVIFANALFDPKKEAKLYWVWTNPPKHPLQEEEPNGDRHHIEKIDALKKLAELENATGIFFKHIRLLAKALTRRNVGYNFLTRGHNQRLEFLGDTVLQLITSDYLYKHFPQHHEGHLSLLRSCLVNNKTQSVICTDLGLPKYLVRAKAQQKKAVAETELRLKDKADLVESFLGAVYVDRGMEFCRAFCRVCFYPRLKYFIMSQRWNDPKSQLQQCCLTLRNAEGEGREPDIPHYRIIGVEGPTNTRLYRVAVYFRHLRLAVGVGHSVQEAEMLAAKSALQRAAHIFPDFVKTPAHKSGSFAKRKKRPNRLPATQWIEKYQNSLRQHGQFSNETAGRIRDKYANLRYQQNRHSPVKQTLRDDIEEAFSKSPPKRYLTSAFKL